MDKQREIMSDTDTQEVQGGHWINHEQEDKKDSEGVFFNWQRFSPPEGLFGTSWDSCSKRVGGGVCQNPRHFGHEALQPCLKFVLNKYI